MQDRWKIDTEGLDGLDVTERAGWIRSFQALLGRLTGCKFGMVPIVAIAYFAQNSIVVNIAAIVAIVALSALDQMFETGRYASKKDTERTSQPGSHANREKKD